MPQFLVVPTSDVSGGFISSLGNAIVAPDPIVGVAGGSFVAFATADISAPFTPTGTTFSPGPQVISGSSGVQFLIVPSGNIDSGGALTNISGAFVSTNTNLTGLISGQEYRVIGLTTGSPPIDTRTIPSAFTAGMWTVSNPSSGGILDFVISSMPYDGGSPITDVNIYQNGSATPIATGLTGPGIFSISGLTNGNTYTFTIKAKNAYGTGPVSDTKAQIPTSSGVATIATVEQEVLAAFAASPDNGWGGFASQTGFTVVNAVTALDAYNAWVSYKNGTPATSKVLVNCNWNGIDSSSPASWGGVNASKLTAYLTPGGFCGYTIPPGGFWLKAGTGFSPIFGTRIEITGVPRIHFDGVRFSAVLGSDPVPTTADIRIRRTSTFPLVGCVAMTDVTTGHMDHRTGTTPADWVRGIMVEEGYSWYGRDVRVAGARQQFTTSTLFRHSVRIESQQCFGDFNQQFGFSASLFANRWVYDIDEYSLVRDCAQVSSATGLHTDRGQKGASSDGHLGYKSINRYSASHVNSAAAVDSGSQGLFRRSYGTWAGQHSEAVYDNLFGLSTYTAFAHVDPSGAGNYFALHNSAFRTGLLDQSGQDSFPQALISQKPLGGTGIASFDRNVITQVNQQSAYTPIIGSNTYVSPRRGVSASGDGSNQSSPMRMENYCVGSGTWVRDAQDTLTYTIANENSTDFWTAWWALHNHFKPITGWAATTNGKDGVRDPNTYPGVQSAP